MEPQRPSLSQSQRQPRAAVDAALKRLAPQFAAMGLPPQLHRLACEKIVDQVFDVGSYVQLQCPSGDDDDDDDDGGDDDDDDDDGDGEDDFDRRNGDEEGCVGGNIGHEEGTAENKCRDRTLTNSHLFVKRKYNLVATETLTENCNVFLIDHMW
jgi:hypothetical protein